MARTPTPKRKAPARAAGKLLAVLVRLPPELVAELDSIAVGLERSRAKVVEFACREYVQAHQRRSAAA